METVIFEEQIISKDKYSSFFAQNGGYCVYYPSNIYASAGLKIGKCLLISHGFRWGIFGHVRRLDRPIAHERKSLMDSKHSYFVINIFVNGKNK